MTVHPRGRYFREHDIAGNRHGGFINDSRDRVRQPRGAVLAGAASAKRSSLRRGGIDTVTLPVCNRRDFDEIPPAHGTTVRRLLTIGS